ncbi:MAG: hypothetical protein ACI92B_001671 [Marinobacter maritimus]|jgi:hypothetical protein|uniref:hypothetical protein n=1 Tax=Marinobacter maritimus TaxID=277961 RepID=UPI000BD8C4D7|nr:hypothetical protein [Marinobacter maritimus]MBL1272127.1 hypothetical protein [Oceanospirillales bacterium]|tara:strand:- start:312 stop:590 length:279 start_codon:yes stop_codon:yes gene_type:complete
MPHVATFQTLISENGFFRYDQRRVGKAPLVANPQQILSVVAGDRFGFDLDTTLIDSPVAGCDETLYQLSLNYACQLLNAQHVYPNSQAQPDS